MVQDDEPESEVNISDLSEPIRTALQMQGCFCRDADHSDGSSVGLIPACLLRLSSNFLFHGQRTDHSTAGKPEWRSYESVETEIFFVTRNYPKIPETNGVDF